MATDDEPAPFKNPPRKCCKCYELKPHAEFVPKRGTQAVLEPMCRACRKGRFKQKMTQRQVINLMKLGRISMQAATRKLNVMHAKCNYNRSKHRTQAHEDEHEATWAVLLGSVTSARDRVRYMQQKFDLAGDLAASVWCSDALKVIAAVRSYITGMKRQEKAPPFAMWWELMSLRDYTKYKKLLMRWPSTRHECPLSLPELRARMKND